MTLRTTGGPLLDPFVDDATLLRPRTRGSRTTKDHTRRLVVAALLAALAAAVAPAAAASRPRPAARVRFPAVGAAVTWGAHHIPVITAHSFGGAGFGEGYAQASDDLCTLADRFVTEQAQRSRFFGPDASYGDQAIGSTYSNLASDFFYERIIDEHTVERLLAAPSPIGPTATARALVEGFAAGYDRYLHDTGVAHLPDSGCRGAPWVRPISALDVWRHVYATLLLSSSRALLEQMVAAKPPLPGTPLPVPTLSGPLKLPGALRPSLGSNAVAIGGDGTRNHRGLLLANPHFPWQGTERFYQSRMEIPGQVDVDGVSLLGLPMIVIGHTSGMAWTHTVNYSFRFALYELTLVPGQPTSYLYDNKVEAMRQQTVTVLARNPDGTLQPRSHTFWETRYGPMTDVEAPALAWNALKGYAIEDVNANNLRLVDQFLAMDRSQSVDQLDNALVRWQGIPWVNTIAADSAGHTLYADISATPHITDQQISDCVTPGVGTAVLKLARLPVLDGSNPACALGSDPDAVQPGVFGPSHLPQLRRSDYVRNSNDPPWLANPHQPLTGYPYVTNDTSDDIGLRPRLSIQMVEERLQGTDGYGPPGFTLTLMQQIALADRNYSAELGRDATVSMCTQHPILPASDGHAIDVSAACAALRGWDLHANLTSRGEGLWKEFWLRVLTLSTPIWRTPFNPANPVDTPSDFDASNPDVQRTFADAVEYLEEQHIAFDAPVGDLQAVAAPGGRIPLHGCDVAEGCFDYIGLANSPTTPRTYHLADYANPNFGSSSIQATTWTTTTIRRCTRRQRLPPPHRRAVHRRTPPVAFTGAAACHTAHALEPVTRTILTYSQSANPAAPDAFDQTAMFSAKQWITPP